jgi:hypothetical protein
MEISPINGDLKLQKRRSGHRLWESLWIPIVLDIRDCFRVTSTCIKASITRQLFFD